VNDELEISAINYDVKLSISLEIYSRKLIKIAKEDVQMQARKQFELILLHRLCFNTFFFSSFQGNPL